MPSETSRKSVRLRVVKPGGDPTTPGDCVDVPIISEITFRDAKAYGQEFVHRINNTDQSSRIGHTHTVKHASVGPDGNVTLDGSSSLEVERTDFTSFIDPKDYAQERKYALFNNDPPPQTPGGDNNTDKAHRLSHFVRYTSDNTIDGVPWIDFEIMDEVEFVDAKEYGQGYIYTLRNPDPGDPVNDGSDPYKPTFAKVDTSLPLVVSDSTTINPPWRFDIFQNPVNVSWKTYEFTVTFTWSDYVIGHNIPSLFDVGYFTVITAPSTQVGLIGTLPLGLTLVSQSQSSFFEGNAPDGGGLSPAPGPGPAVFGYSQSFTFKLSSVPPIGHQLDIQFAISGQEDYTDIVFVNGLYDDGPLPFGQQGPYVFVNAVGIAGLAGCSIGGQVIPIGNTSGPNSGPDRITSLYVGGQFTLSIGTVENVNGSGAPGPAVWPSAPTYRRITDAWPFGTTVHDVGVYVETGHSTNYKFGGPPIPANVFP